MTTTYIGRAQNRTDGPAKVTGEAKYAAEYDASRLAHGWVVGSAIARGRITRIDAQRALAVPGVLRVFTHENRPEVASYDRSDKKDAGVPGSRSRPLYDERIHYSGQPIALVVAERLETARYAASLVRVEYEQERHVTDLHEQRDAAYDPKDEDGSASAKDRGDAEGAFAQASVRHEAEYTHPCEHHNPMEMHASTVVWHDDGKLTVYEKTQGASRTQKYLTRVFGLSKEDVRVVCSYVGGAFGSGLRAQYQLFLAVLAACELKRPVRVALTRQQMFTIGYRPDTIQRLAFGANEDGTLQSIRHDAIGNTSRFEDFTENDVSWSAALYKCENIKRSYKVAKLDLFTPIDMRAPGGATGVYAIECAIDELAYKLGIDPLELRLRNDADRDYNDDRPFSSRALRECFRQGAEKFGWSKRNPNPRSMREGNELIGWGMATGIWEAMRLKASARAVLTDDGKLEVSSATTDIGTGTYTIMTQIAAEMLGLPIGVVGFRLGDSSLPEAPIQGGSFTAASVGSAVQAACDKVREKLLRLAQTLPASMFAGAKVNDVRLENGLMTSTREPSQRVSLLELMRSSSVSCIDEMVSAELDEETEKRYAMYIHSAVFAEVRVDVDFGTVRATRIVDAVAGGRIINPKTAASQVSGGVVWGVGMALHEESLVDHALGRFMNHNYADYHVPVNADIEAIDVIFVEEHDHLINPLGVKGLGEIGIVGTAAAIANAVFHATGKRVRDLPITLDKLL